MLLEDPMENREKWGWQARAPTMTDRIAYLLEHNVIPFNITFKVGSHGEEIIEAHRLHRKTF